MLLHEVPHDPGARHQVIIKWELVSILTRAEYELGPLTVVTTDQRRLSWMLVMVGLT